MKQIKHFTHFITYYTFCFFFRSRILFFWVVLKCVNLNKRDIVQHHIHHSFLCFWSLSLCLYPAQLHTHVIQRKTHELALITQIRTKNQLFLHSDYYGVIIDYFGIFFVLKSFVCWANPHAARDLTHHSLCNFCISEIRTH